MYILRAVYVAPERADLLGPGEVGVAQLEQQARALGQAQRQQGRPLVVEQQRAAARAAQRARTQRPQPHVLARQP